MRKLLVLVTGALAVTLTVAALGAASRGVERYKLTATLTAKQEVPRPKGAAAARGTFLGGLIESGSTKKVAWRLTFSKLTGRAVQAHIHLGKTGKAGPIAVALCAPCKSGAKGTKVVKSSVADAIKRGRAYVNVHTAKNAGGEIRGQIKSTGI